MCAVCGCGCAGVLYTVYTSEYGESLQSKTLLFVSHHIIYILYIFDVRNLHGRSHIYALQHYIQYESNLLIKYSKFESRKFVPALEIVISQNMVSGPAFYDRIYIPVALIYGGMTWRR